MKSKRLLLVPVLIAGLLTPLIASAGPDEAQRQMMQRLAESKQKLAEIEKASAGERSKLMDAHMKSMQETMGKMHDMKPKKGASMHEHEEWMTEHQKLMEQVMDQMMREHQMMMK